MRSTRSSIWSVVASSSCWSVSSSSNRDDIRLLLLRFVGTQKESIGTGAKALRSHPRISERREKPRGLPNHVGKQPQAGQKPAGAPQYQPSPTPAALVRATLVADY